MDHQFEKATEQAVAFQKIWMESATKIMQAAFTMGPNSPPPEILRQIRTGIFQALANSWEEFMRSPQFLEGMKQWTENAISFRKLSNDFMAKIRNELQAPSRDDMDSIMLTIRHVEKRLLDRIDDLAAQLGHQNAAKNGRTNQPRSRGAARRKTTRSRTPTQKVEAK